MRLIDADRFKNWIMDRYICFDHTLDDIDAQPTIDAIPVEQAKESTYAQSIGKCETCCYWGNRMILRDGSLGDCGNFEKNLSKDFYCAWWSQKEKGGEQDEL